MRPVNIFFHLPTHHAYAYHPAMTSSIQSFRKFAAEIARAETALKRAGISVSKLCHAADIDRSTWHRWKAGTMTPPDERWAKVRKVLERMTK